MTDKEYKKNMINKYNSLLKEIRIYERDIKIMEYKNKLDELSLLQKEIFSFKKKGIK